MQNSSLHSFSLRLHFHAQYLQNKAYKHLMAKIFPEQLGYLTLPAPSRFPNASKALSRWGGGGRRSYPREPDPPEQPHPTQRCHHARDPGCPRTGRPTAGPPPHARRFPPGITHRRRSPGAPRPAPLPPAARKRRAAVGP